MSRDYSIYLENLKGRRYDEVLREPVLSEGFSRYEYGDAIRYALESMQEIDPAYTYKNYSTARRTQEIINNRLNETDLQVDFRYQGPISTNCHIQLYGDIELIVISRQYSKKPSKEVEVLAMEMVEALTATQLYKYVDYSERWKVNIKTLKPACEISILPAVWVDSSLYRETTREIDRGICEYNLSKRTRRMYLPFLNIARVNAMEKRVNGGLKCLTRLLRCLQRDAEDEIDLTYDEIIGSLYHLKPEYLTLIPGRAMRLLMVANAQLDRLINNKDYRERLVSPSRKEFVFGQKQQKVEELKKLKAEVADLLYHIKAELADDGKTLKDKLPYS